jgi:hypothetical protein
MTAILGYVSDVPKENKSMFLLSDDLVIWHYTNKPDEKQENYEKIFQFNNLLISFNGEVKLFEVFKKVVKSIPKNIDNISDFQNAVNKVFPCDYFRDRSVITSYSRYSNIIILDTQNRILAHHYAGNVWFPAKFYCPFHFEQLPNNLLYHFGSIVSMKNELSNTEDSFKKESNDYIKENIEEQLQISNMLFKETNDICSGIGKLYSFYLVDKNGEPILKQIDKI